MAEVDCLKHEAERMARTFLKSLLIGKLRHSRRSGTAGFTLLELLIVSLISGLLISGLMYLVVELLAADQRESSRTETQRDMQMAMDYISTELKEAVYVYTGECMAGTVVPCPGLAASLPTVFTADSTPVLAFWKQQPIPNALRVSQCSQGTQTLGGQPVPCILGNSYSLVVYSLNTANAAQTWQGRARITRYALSEFNSAGTARTTGYAQVSSNFDGWTSTTPRPTGTPDVLVDFVDDGVGATTVVGAGNPDCPNDPSIPGTEYLPSPITSASPTTVAPAAKSFFACVNRLTLTSTPYRDVVLFLRGSISGRPGFRGADRAFLPTLETRVLTRGVLQREPGRATGTGP